MMYALKRLLRKMTVIYIDHSPLPLSIIKEIRATINSLVKEPLSKYRKDHCKFLMSTLEFHFFQIGHQKSRSQSLRKTSLKTAQWLKQTYYRIK